MLDIGLNTDDLYSLERLSSPRILKRLPRGQRYLRHNSKDDLIVYLKAWVELLEEEAIVAKPVAAPLLEAV